MKYSLMIGRFQPFHDGHEALVRKLLAEGKNVCIGIRDTKVDSDNPHPVMKRYEMIMERFAGEKARGIVEIAILPDIEEVVYGRNVGWGMREIRLDEETEAISATKIREAQDDS